MPIPLQIVSGFLGAGKTSAILAQLEQDRGRRIAVIVNDFGEASLDELALSEGEPFRITSIAGACVCCTAPEGFVDALGAVLEGEPDRVLIEPTGLARPQDLIDTVRRSPHAERVELEPLVVLVDPAQLDDLSAGAAELFAEQVGAADILVANRTDLCGERALEHFERWAAELWPAPLAVLRTTHGRLDPAALAWPAGAGPSLPRDGQAAPHAHSHSTEGFAARSWCWPPDALFSRERLGAALARLAAGEAGAKLVRFKGIFRTQEGVLRIEVAGGTRDERPCAYRRDSRVDLIVEGDAAALERAGAWIGAARLGEDERQLSTERIELVAGAGRVHLIDREALLALPDALADVSELFPERAGSAARLRALWRSLELPDDGHVIVVAGDGFASEPVPVETFCEGVLLHTLRGEPLPAAKGGPFRLLIPEPAGAPLGACANVKGVAKLVLR